MPRKTTRRDFVKTSAAVGAGFWVAGGVSPKTSRAANEEISFAAIGVDGKGRSDSADAGRRGNMVAICDIDDTKLDKAARRFKEAERFHDYREMLDKMGDKIDAVTVSTPDHVHAVASAKAMKMGKHCFCQKPLTRSIYEARTLGDIARENGVATQMGNQGTAGGGLREAAAFLQDGGLGKVSEVHVWTNRPVWPQGIDRPEDTESAPDYIKWDLWVGPSEMRGYAPGVYHPFNWRGWWDFGSGALGDMACHTVNMPFMGLMLKDPTSVVAETSGHNGETYPSWSVIDYEFPELDGRAPLKMTWYDGGKTPDASLLEGRDMPKSGALIIGEKGKLFSPGDYGGSYELIGLEKPKDIEYERSPGHFDEWVRAIKSGEQARSNFPEYAGPLTEVILLGNLAVWTAKEGKGKKIEWDAKNLKATNAPEVADIVKPKYRDGYSL